MDVFHEKNMLNIFMSVTPARYKFDLRNMTYLFITNNVQAGASISHIDSLVKDCSNSVADALELTQFCTKQSGTKPNLVAKFLATKFGFVPDW